MAFKHNQQGIEAYGFDAACIQKGGVDTGGEFVCKNGVAGAQALSGILETCRWGAIHQLKTGNGFEDGAHLFFYPVGTQALVAVEGGVAGPTFKYGGCCL